ncbi:MAG: DUF342 domain-containing protein [Deltaproteobacteria bacterium]|nr:DUF342 domain-containing protein [Deltaproteobacteria bacterium]
MAESLTIEARGGRVYLRVPQDPAPLSAVVRRLRQDLPGVAIDWVAVREAYLYGRGRAFPVAHRTAEAFRGEKAKIRFSDDGLTAYLILYPPKGRGARLTEGELGELVRAYGVPDELLDADALRRAFLRRSYLEPEGIARGRPPVDGHPSRVEWRGGAPVDPDAFLSALEAGADMAEPSLLVVEPGQAAGTFVPPGRGTPGLTVRGDPIPPRPGENRVRLGTGLGLAPDGRTVVAQAAGQIRFTDPERTQACLMPVVRVASAQDLRRWRDEVIPATVVVEGDLEAPFPVRVLGDLEIRGSLIRSPVEVMGSLFTTAGVIQTRTVPLRVGGVVSAEFFERAHVIASVIHVRRYSMKGRLTALRAIWVADGGACRGGLLEAGERIRAGELGSPNNLPTEVSVGRARIIDPFRAAFSGWADLISQQARTEGAPASLGATADEWEARAQALPEPDPICARVEAERVFPGVTVRVGTAVRKMENPVGRVEFTYERFGPHGRVAMQRKG